jgi:hypothetical protein
MGLIAHLKFREHIFEAQGGVWTVSWASPSS